MSSMLLGTISGSHSASPPVSRLGCDRTMERNCNNPCIWSSYLISFNGRQLVWPSNKQGKASGLIILEWIPRLISTGCGKKQDPRNENLCSGLVDPQVEYHWVYFHSASRSSQTAQVYRAYDAITRVSRFNCVITKMAAEPVSTCRCCVVPLYLLNLSFLYFRSPLETRWHPVDAGSFRMLRRPRHARGFLGKRFMNTLLSLFCRSSLDRFRTLDTHEKRQDFTRENGNNTTVWREFGSLHARVEINYIHLLLIFKIFIINEYN